MHARVRTKVQRRVLQRRAREIIAYTSRELRDRLINVAPSFLSLPRNSLLNRACISMRNLHVTRSRNAERRARASTLFMVCFSCSLIKPIATESACVFRAAACPLPYFQSIPSPTRRRIGAIDLSFIDDDFVRRFTSNFHHLATSEIRFKSHRSRVSYNLTCFNLLSDEFW